MVRALRPVLGRRHAESGLECSGEGLKTAVAGAFRDLGNRYRAVCQLTGSLVQAQAAHGRRDRFPVQTLIDPVPVIRRQARDFREANDIQWFVEVVVDVLEHAA